MNKEQGRFTPTLLGEKVSDLLVKSFEDIFDVGFTARMEDELDEIEEGKLPWQQIGKGILGSLRKSISETASDKMVSRTRSAFPPGKSARSAAKANCSNASAGTDSFWAARVIRSAISSRILPSTAATTWKRDGDRNIATIAGRK